MEPGKQRATLFLTLTSLGLIAALLFVLVPLLWDGTNSYVDRNEDLLRTLPVFPGARQVFVESNSYRLSESGPVAGYGTRATFEASGVSVEELLAFFESNLGPDWVTWRDSISCRRLEDGSACPSMMFLRATRGGQYVSVDPSNLTTPMGSYDVCVDHESHLADATPAGSPPPAPSPTPTFTPIAR